MEYAAKSGKPVLGICLGMQMMNTYFLVAEEAERRGWDGPLLALFEQMKKSAICSPNPWTATGTAISRGTMLTASSIPSM